MAIRPGSVLRDEIAWPAVRGLPGQHPDRIFRREAADLIKLLKIVSIEPQFDRREIFLELGKALRPRDNRGDEWLGKDLLSVV